MGAEANVKLGGLDFSYVPQTVHVCLFDWGPQVTGVFLGVCHGQGAGEFVVLDGRQEKSKGAQVMASARASTPPKWLLLRKGWGSLSSQHTHNSHS